MDCLLETFIDFQALNGQASALLLAADSFWMNPKSWWAMAQVVLGLGFVIFVHELGHFLLAKSFGVKCEKFYVGFDAFDIKIGDRVIIPKSLVKWQWGETEYGIGIVPLGGYVKMLGQDDDPRNIEKEVERSKLGNDTEEDEQLSETGWHDRSKMDPRSFLAKSVPQRMAIISAGVIFNLFFAIIFAALAFKSGVNYEPPIVGSVVSGGPAWENDLAGVSVTSVGGKKVEGYFPFRDMAEIIALHGAKPIDLEFTRPGSSDVEKISVTPEMIERMGMKLPLIGITGAVVPKIADDDDFAIKSQPAYEVRDQFQKNDMIVSVGSVPVKNASDLQYALAAKIDKEVQFEVQRESSTGVAETATVVVGTNPRRETGIVTEWGPVAAIRIGSPAEKAGFQVGDVVTQINNQPRKDLLTLDQRLARNARDNRDTPIDFQIKRGDEELTLSVVPNIPRGIGRPESGRPLSVNSIGLAIETTNIIEESSIDGINPGDELVDIEFVFPDDDAKKAFKEVATNSKVDLIATQVPHLLFFKRTVPGSEWQTIDSTVQMLPIGANMKVTTREQGSESEEDYVVSEFATTESSQFFNPTRGIKLTSLQHNYKSHSWGDAFRYGALQTWNDCRRIGKFLKKLFVGGISPKSLGGPGTIAVVATSEASQGTSRLLLFLTLLSANLAIVNFLPIPVLDGGHFLFLCYEGLFRRPVSERVQMVLTYAGLFLILGLMAFVLYLDATRISGMM